MKNNRFSYINIVAQSLPACLALALFGCAGRGGFQPSPEQRSAELKARHIDIPLPLGVNVIERSLEQDSDSNTEKRVIERGFFFETAMTPKEVAFFYEQEMEVAGWIKESFFTQIDRAVVLFYKKGKKELLVMMDPLQGGQKVHLFYKNYGS